MGSKGVETKKKKKGRPSLLDLQKRSLKEQQQQQLLQQQKSFSNSIPNSNPNCNNSTNPTPTPIRRSTRRSSNPVSIDADSIARGEEEEVEEDDDALQASDANAGSEKDEKHVPGTVPTQGVGVDGSSLTPLPDTNLLLFIIDKLQKKDTHGVFSEPVDSEELPDYHEIIQHPMDFATLKQKLAGGEYAHLEQFEKDVLLICSNAMQYNPSDTIYFRQARSIQELAKKYFENLRQDSDNNEPSPKIVRRGRPPKNLKKRLNTPSSECAGAEASDAKPAIGGESANWSSYDLRRVLQDKSAPPDSSRQSIYTSRSNGAYSGWSTDQKLGRNEEFTGSVLKRVKNGNYPLMHDDSRRNTYEQCQPSAGVMSPSVFDPFDGKTKMLLAVGLHSEHGYARSLCRYAASLGPVTWKIASQKMQKCLPAGVKFGPGWVGEAEKGRTLTSAETRFSSPDLNIRFQSEVPSTGSPSCG